MMYSGSFAKALEAILLFGEELGFVGFFFLVVRAVYLHSLRFVPWEDTLQSYFQVAGP